MSVYRVLVAHNGYRVNQVIETDTPVLRYVREVPGATEDRTAELRRGDVDPDSFGADLPRKRRKTIKPEVTDDEQDRSVPDSGLPDSEG